MKKIIILFLILFSLLSCQETKIENNLSENKKEIEKKEEKKMKKISYGDFYTMIGDNKKGKIKIKISSVNWEGNSFNKSYSPYIAKNKWLVIKLESENVGKKPTFISLSNLKIITKDGYEYSSKNAVQVITTKKGYNGCIECENNPGDKSEQYVLFDIKKRKLDGSVLKFKKKGIKFELGRISESKKEEGKISESTMDIVNKALEEK